jgi:hypothetical protein
MKRRLRAKIPVIQLSGLAACGLATIVGIVAGVEPFVIMYRAGISACIVACTMALGVGLVDLANTRPEPAKARRRKQA